MKLPDYVDAAIETLGFTVAVFEDQRASLAGELPSPPELMPAIVARSDQISAALREFVIAQLEGKTTVIDEPE